MADQVLAPTFTVRRGADDDIRTCQRILWESATDLGTRMGAQLSGTADEWWSSSEPLHRLLAETAAEWWVAESGDGTLIGYARSVQRGGLLELTEFFVLPGHQSGGVGRALLERAFPMGRHKVRSILATSDVRALARYYAAGVAARCAYFTLGRSGGAEAGTDAIGDLVAERLDGGSPAVLSLLAIEGAVVGFERGEAEMRWLLANREGYLYRRGEADAGFGFVGLSGAGPVATLDPEDQPAILDHLEGRAHAVGLDRIEFEVPSVNEVAVRHLMQRGYRLDGWINFLMSDRPFGQFDRYIGYSPPIFL